MNNAFAFLPMQDANNLLGDSDALRHRLDQDGYLLFRKVLDVEKVRWLRGLVLSALAGRGWVERPAVARTARCLIPPLREEDEEYKLGYDEIQKLEQFHGLAHDPRLMEVMQQVLGPSAFPHPLKIARLAFPGHFEASTPPHQDFPNNQGTPSLTATWIPLTDIDLQLGGLAVLRGSHKWGPLPLARHLGAGNRCAVLPDDLQEKCRWVTTDYEVGDVLLFPSLTVHAALHNASDFLMRLSVDFRYQLEGEQLTPGVLEPHFGRMTWDQIYEGWRSTKHQYYWRDLDYEVVPFDEYPLENHDLTGEFTNSQLREIYAYHERVEARYQRRLELLGQGPSAAGSTDDD